MNWRVGWVRLVDVSLLPHVEFGTNDQREDAPLFDHLTFHKVVYIFPMLVFCPMRNSSQMTVRGDASHFTDTSSDLRILGNLFIYRPLVVFQLKYMNIPVFLLVLCTKHEDKILFQLLWLVYPFWAFRLGNHDLHFRPYSSFDLDYIPVANFRDDLLTQPITHLFII